MYALNLTLSPENKEFWERADPIAVGAGETGIAVLTSGFRHPGVSDSIEPDNDDEVTRQASEPSKVLGETFRIGRIVAEYGRPT